MGVQARRFAILVVALSVLSVALVACQAAALPTGGSGTGKSLVFATAAANSVSPTPTFPSFTIGAWPSNYSPGNPDTITIYVICRVQDPTMQSPARPPNPGVPVTIFVQGAINQTFTATTGPDGIATAQVAFSDPNPGVPVIVQVSAVYQQHSYINQTFFTPGATFTPTPTLGPGVTPGTTPSTGP
jgi:PAB1-binding protein PBP1